MSLTPARAVDPAGTGPAGPARMPGRELVVVAAGLRWALLRGALR